MIELEFREYDKDNSGRISEADLCKFLLKNTKVGDDDDDDDDANDDVYDDDDDDCCLDPTEEEGCDAEEGGEDVAG